MSQTFFSTFRRLLNTTDSISDIIDCALAIDWSAAYDDIDNHSDCEMDIQDVIIGLYWHCVHWHGGQSSDTYKLQCILGTIYSPGRCDEDGPKEDTCSWDVYSQLEALASEA